MKLLINPSNRLVKVLNDDGATLKGFCVDCISVTSLMYQKKNEDVWHEIKVSYTNNPSCIVVNGVTYKNNVLVDILTDTEIKSFFLADTKSVVMYDNGKMIEASN